MHVYLWHKGRWEGLLIDKDHPKHQFYQIVLALDLTTLNFNGLWTIDFFKFKPTVGDGSMSEKLGLVPDHGMKRVSEGLDWSKVGPTGPHRARLHKQLLIAEHTPC